MWFHRGGHIVSIHAPVRGAARAADRCWRWGGCFDPRSRAGSDVHYGCPSRGPHGFRSTLPCGERRRATASAQASSMFRSTLPCGERPGSCRRCRRRWDVSIHAPVRGATIDDSYVVSTPEFRSTLPCGERRCEAVADGRTKMFRSTLPCGERRCIDGTSLLGRTVSIHAPVRGATRIMPAMSSAVGCFDPRSRAGSDPLRRIASDQIRRFDPRSRAGSDIDIIGRTASLGAFRSTLPCGERQGQPGPAGACRRFDPRSRAGSDTVPSPFVHVV